MRKVLIDEQKSIQLKILKYIDSLCKKHDLHYSLYAGTLIGAIRHNGFIPWDDDIDICMVRSEYQKLLSILETQNDYRLLTQHNTKDYHYGFAKLADKSTILKTRDECLPDIDGLGVYVDIFPIDGLPSDKKMIEKHFKDVQKQIDRIRLSLPKRYYYASKKWKKALKRFVLFPLHIFYRSKGTECLKQDLEKLLIKYKFADSVYCGSLLTRYGKAECVNCSVYSSFILKDFEGNDFSIISDYETYLRSVYGDYMKLPPQEKRVPIHDYDVYTIERS